MPARVCPPRSASPCLFRPFPPLNIFLANLPRPGPPEFSTRSDGGSRGFTGPHPTFPPSLCFLSPSVSSGSPDTSDGHASRPRRGPQRSKATTRPSPQPRSLNFPILIFGLPGPTLLLGSFYNLHFACTTTRTKHVVFPVTRPQIVFFTKTISRCQGNSRSGRPVAVYGAPLNLLRAIIHFLSPVGLVPTACPLHLSPRSPYADTIFPRPSLYHDLHAHGDQCDPLISQAPATITLCIRVFYNRAPVSIWNRQPHSHCKRLLAQYDSHSHCMPPGVHVLAPPAAKASH